MELDNFFNNPEYFNKDNLFFNSVNPYDTTFYNRKKLISINEALREYSFEEREKILQAIKELKAFGIGKFFRKNTYIPKLKLSMSKESLEKIGSLELQALDCEISKDCNLNCIHCREENPRMINCGGCRKGYNLKNSLTLKDWKKVIEEASLFRCKKIRFIGGEPFLVRDELLELIDWAQQLKYPHMEIVTNATLIDEKIIKYLRSIENLSLTIPFYSFNPIIHDSITMERGSFQKAMRNISKMRDLSININIYLLVLKPNQSTVEETINFFDKLKIRCSIDVPMPIGSNFESDLFSDKFKDKVYKEKPIFDNVNLFKFFFAMYWNPCWGFKVAVKNDGDVIPCIRAREEIAGNIRDTSLRELIIHGKMMKYWEISKERIDGCKECEFRFACEDCRVLAKALGGTIYSQYPFCNYPHQEV